MSEQQIVSRLKVRRIRWSPHLHFVSFCGCVVPGCQFWRPRELSLRIASVDVTLIESNPHVAWHHVRRSSNSGTAVKPGDDETVGLCHILHHIEGVHRLGEKTCSARWDIDLMACARELAAASRALGILPPE